MTPVYLWFSDYLFLFKHFLQSPYIYKYGYTGQTSRRKYGGRGEHIIFIFVLSRCRQTIITRVQDKNIDGLGIISEKQKTKSEKMVISRKKLNSWKKQETGDCSVISGSVAAVKSS